MTDGTERALRERWKSWRSGLLRRLSREVPPSVPYAPTTFVGYDRVACKCGPAADLEPGYHTDHGGLHCRVCSKAAPGAVQIAWHYLERVEHPLEPTPWYGLTRCPFCGEPGRVLHPNCNDYSCLSCGERIDRQLLKSRQIQARDKSYGADASARAKMWRQRLGDVAGPPPTPADAGACVAALDRAAETLTKAGLAPDGVLK